MSTRRHHLESLWNSGEARQSLRASCSRQQPKIDLWQTELRSRDGHPVVRAQCNFEASTKGGAMDCGDHWDWGVLHRILDLLKAGALWSSTEFTDVGTRNKGSPLAKENDAGCSIAHCGSHAIE